MNKQVLERLFSLSSCRAATVSGLTGSKSRNLQDAAVDHLTGTEDRPSFFLEVVTGKGVQHMNSVVPHVALVLSKCLFFCFTIMPMPPSHL